MIFQGVADEHGSDREQAEDREGSEGHSDRFYPLQIVSRVTLTLDTIQPAISVSLSNRWITKVNSSCSYLVQIPSSVVQAPVLAFSAEMSAPEHVGKLCLRKWCTTVVLIAICSLTVSLLTRYTAPLGISSLTAKTASVHGTPSAKKQHLAKDAADWIPPVTTIHILVPSCFSIVAATTESVLSRVPARTPYNRPPPSSTFLG